MKDIKERAQGLNPSVEPRNLNEISEQAEGHNIYEALTVISERAKQISRDLKRELHSKLQEFASSTDSLEEIHENKEQIEISKFYERLPNPVLISFDEYTKGTLQYRFVEDDDNIQSGF